MRTGDGIQRFLLVFLVALSLIPLICACKVEETPDVRIDLSASKNPISPDEFVQITATATKDGSPLTGETLILSVSPVGSFPDGNILTTDAVGQAAANLLVPAESVASDTQTEVTATITNEELTFTGSLIVAVDVAVGGPR